MTDQSRKVFERLYASAREAEDLPWHSEEPPVVLVEALAARSQPGTALDAGCGAGTCSLYLARRGWRITAVDFMPQAIDMLNRKARAEQLAITAEQADILSWTAPEPFDLVLDVGCLHSVPRKRHADYRRQLLRWLAPGGDFVLVHCGRRHFFDWWPIGPNRIYREELCRLFGPELTLQSFRPREMKGLPIFMGFSAQVGQYWFRRSTE